MSTSAHIVIIGGGAVGTGVALQLAEAGFRDILLLERESSLCAVTSPQAAGLVGQVRSSLERTKLAMWSVATFARLERESEMKPSWRQTGSLRLAQADERVAEFRHMMMVAKEAGLEVELLDAPAAAKLWPHLDFAAAKAILFCPTDGYLQPADLVASYQHEARRLGVRFKTSAGVAGIRLENGRVAGVVTQEGEEIACAMAINAAGAHGYHVGRLVGLDLPVIPVRHHYMITTSTDWIRPDMPVLRMPDGTLYARADVNALLIGGWEPEAMSLDPRSYGLTDRLPAIAEDWPVLANFMEEFRPFGGALCDQPIRHVFTGWPTFTPDGRFIIGESAAVPGFVCAAGCNAHGVSGSAGIGRHVVEALTEKEPSPYVKSLSPQRFAGGFDWDEARRKAQHVLETYYHIGH